MNRAAQALGRLAKGVPKNFSASELARRKKLMAGINGRRQKSTKAKSTPKTKCATQTNQECQPVIPAADNGRVNMVRSLTAPYLKPKR